MTASIPSPRAAGGWQRWFQFRLRTMAVLVTLASIMLALVASHQAAAMRQQQAVLAYHKAAGSTPRPLYDYELEHLRAGKSLPAPPPYGRWESRFGRDFFHSVIAVDGDGDFTEVFVFLIRNPCRLERQPPAIRDAYWNALDAFPHLESLVIQKGYFEASRLDDLPCRPKLRRLWLAGGGLSHEDLRVLASFPRLEYLDLSGAELAPGALQSVGSIPRLKYLDLWHANVPPGELRHLAGLNLEGLAITGITIDDRDLEHIATIRPLRWLDLSRTKVTDWGVKFLRPLENLETLGIANTRATRRSLTLADEMPRLRDIWLVRSPPGNRWDLENGF